MTTAAWAQTRVWYHLYPLGFLNAERENPRPGAPDGPRTHRLRELHGWLDYLEDLGVGGILLGPVFASETHGYDTVDPFQVDRRLGDEADLVGFVEACHARDLRVLLDGVFNHVGRGFPRFQDVLANRERSPSRSWFRLDFDRDGPDGFAYDTFEGHDHLVALDHADPQVEDWAVEVATHWLDRGVDGWRLDAAYLVPTDFWRRFQERVRAQHPSTFFVAEAIQGGDYGRLTRDAGLPSVTQYELWKALWSALNDRNFHELAHALDRHRQHARVATPWTFLGNHDTTRIFSRLRDGWHLGHALATLLTLPGVAAVYAGDEQAAEGTKRHGAGGDDDIRRPPPHGTRPEGTAREVFDLHAHLIRLRRERPWLARAQARVVDLDNRHLTFEVRGEDARLRVGLNVDDRPSDVPTDGLAPLAGHPEPHLPPNAWGVWG